MLYRRKSSILLSLPTALILWLAFWRSSLLLILNASPASNSQNQAKKSRNSASSSSAESSGKINSNLIKMLVASNSSQKRTSMSNSSKLCGNQLNDLLYIMHSKGLQNRLELVASRKIDRGYRFCPGVTTTDTNTYMGTTASTFKH